MEVPNNSRHLAMASHNLAEVLAIPKIQQEEQERKPRPQADQSLKCPRCDSTNTKFCYYNNYSLSQPRYFCKGCRRYWTQGGSLRNVPVGGGCRKNKRSSLQSSNSTTSAAAKKTLVDNQSLIHTPPSNMINSSSNPVMLPSLIAPQLPDSLSYDANDLTLAFAGLQKNQHNFDNHQSILLGHANNSSAEQTNTPTYGFLDILKSGFVDQNVGATPSGLNNLYYGFGANNNMSVDIGAAGSGMSNEEQGNSGKELDEGETKLFMGLQWQDNNLSLDNSGRDYWSSIGSSNWNGLINSSLI